MANKCKDCGCTCKRCVSSDQDVQLHVEIENLKQRLLEKENHIVTMETTFLNEANKFPNGELVAAREELLTWQDKYRRLYEAHRRVQRVNQGLEDKLLKLVDICETEKNTLTKDVATLSHKLAEANYAIRRLTEDNERYKNDVSLAIQFLQCKQSNFVTHKFDSLPPEMQSQLSNYITPKKKSDEHKIGPELKSIKVPIPTFPPTAMVYSVPKSPNPDRRQSTSSMEEPASGTSDIISPAVVAKVLEERQRKRGPLKHCETCSCDSLHGNITQASDIGTQTQEFKGVTLCWKCGEGDLGLLPGGIKIIRNQDSKAQKPIPICPLECADSAAIPQATTNIVKVQPNNFLLDNKSKTNSNNSSLLDLSKPSSPKNILDPNNHVISSELNVYKDVNYTENQHHKLCDKSIPNYEIESTSDKADSEKNVDITSAKNNNDNPKGPRYCSMRVQTGTRNILLDNAHNNIAPVLYTRVGRKHDETAQTHETSNMESLSGSSDCNKINSMASETSTQNQQRVAEWIQNNIDNDAASSPDISRSESLRGKGRYSRQNLTAADVDKQKYAQMEENVKRFLFGESEFLKTVELGKKKYQTLRDGVDEGCGSKETKI